MNNPPVAGPQGGILNGATMKAPRDFTEVAAIYFGFYMNVNQRLSMLTKKAQKSSFPLIQT